MLPEQAFRDAPHRSITQRSVRLRYLAHLLREHRRSNGKRLNEKPRTLTGDDWRNACEARDREAGKALDAVY